MEFWLLIYFQARLCLYPEGTRNSSSTLLPFKKGAFHVAIASQAPIQPIIVSRYYFLDDTKKLFNPGKFTNKLYVA
jgi:lysophosphatidate acyltransferase